MSHLRIVDNLVPVLVGRRLLCAVPAVIVVHKLVLAHDLFGLLRLEAVQGPRDGHTQNMLSMAGGAHGVEGVEDVRVVCGGELRLRRWRRVGVLVRGHPVVDVVAETGLAAADEATAGYGWLVQAVGPEWIQVSRDQDGHEGRC